MLLVHAQAGKLAALRREGQGFYPHSVFLCYNRVDYGFTPNPQSDQADAIILSLWPSPEEDFRLWSAAVLEVSTTKRARSPFLDGA